MKKVSLFIFLILSVTSLFAQIKRYEVKSAVIEYDITGSGNMMGMTTKIIGSSKVFFKDYGAVEINDENIKQNIMGQNENTHDLIKFEKDTVYSVDFEDNIIYKHKISSSTKEMFVKDTDEKSLKNLGGKKVGTEKIAGYTCDIWQLKSAKISIYKGVPLRIETNIMGISQIRIAKKIELNVSINDSKFNLPNYPIKIRDDMMNEAMKGMENMSPEQKKMMQDMMNNVGGMFGGQK